MEKIDFRWSEKTMTYTELQAYYYEQTGKTVSLAKISKLAKLFNRLPTIEELAEERKVGRPSKFKPITLHDYQMLLDKSKKYDSTPIDRTMLFYWFERFGGKYWNGECYVLEDGQGLYPIYKGIGEPDEDGEYPQYKLMDAEIR